MHPYAYAESLRSKYVQLYPKWEEYHNYELEVAKRWYESIASMNQDDVIVYHPCYESDEEKALAEYGRKKLEDRFLRLSGRQIQTPEGATPETMAALAPDISEAFQVRGKYVWYAHDLRIAVFSYNYAQDILRIFKERGIHFNPESVALRTMGESFEGCANNWTTMLPDYLGIKGRVEMPFELSVPDTLMLLGCRCIKRKELPYETALYLFIDKEGKPVILFVRERVRLADKSYYASLSLEYESISISIRDGSIVFSNGEKIADMPPPSFIRRGSGGNPEIMVASGRWRGGERAWFTGRESHLFITTNSLDTEAFFTIAEKAIIMPENH